MKINWYIAVVVVIILGVACALYAMGKPTPGFSVAALGVVLHALLPSLVKRTPCPKIEVTIAETPKPS